MLRQQLQRRCTVHTAFGGLIMHVKLFAAPALAMRYIQVAVNHLAANIYTVSLRRAHCTPMSSATAKTSTAATGQRWSLAIHGGAGVINSTHTDWLDDAKRGLEASLRAGQAVLESGGSAIDAVVAAVVSMENDPHFNAGMYA